MMLRQIEPRRARRKTDSHDDNSGPLSLPHYLKTVHTTKELCNESTLVKVFFSSKVP